MVFQQTFIFMQISLCVYIISCYLVISIICCMTFGRHRLAFLGNCLTFAFSLSTTAPPASPRIAVFLSYAFHVSSFLFFSSLLFFLSFILSSFHLSFLHSVDPSVPPPQLLRDHCSGSAGVSGGWPALPAEEQPGVHLQQDWLGHGRPGRTQGQMI